MAIKSETQKIEIGKRIKAVRQSFGLEQGEFGKRLTPPAYASNVSKWELGKHLPSSQRLQSISEIGHMSVDYLLNGFTSDKYIKELSKKLKGYINMTGKIRLKLPKDSYVHTKEGNEGHFINCKEDRDENYIEVTREGLDVLLNDIFKSNKNPNVGSRKLEKGSIATDWTPSPLDKINVSDMRKPASDVAEIEESEF